MPDVYISRTKNINKFDANVLEQRHTHNPLVAYSYQPDSIHFETQDPGEKIILFLRQHPLTNLPWILVAIVMALAPMLLSFFPLLSFLPANLITAALLLWYLLVVAVVLEGFLYWFFNVYIVTDERIIDFDFYNLIYKEISEAKIDKIQDVTYKVGGVVRTLFNYGDVLIQTAGTIPNFDFAAVPNPSEVVRILQALRTEEEQEAIEGRVR